MKYGLLALLMLLFPMGANASANRLGGTLPQDAEVDDEIKLLLNRGYIELNVAHRFHHGSTSKSGCDFLEPNKSYSTHTVKIPLQRSGISKDLVMGAVEIESTDPDVNYWIYVSSWKAPSGLYLDYSAHIKFQGSTLGAIKGASGQGVIYKDRRFQKVGQDYLIRLIPERKCLLAEFAVSDHTTPIRLPKSFNKRIQ